MTIRYFDAPILLGGLHWLDGALVTNAANVTTVERADGTVLSVQPSGDFEGRPSGTAGAWEACSVDPDNNVLVYRGTGIVYKVPYRGR